jgi:hypothetical protein
MALVFLQCVEKLSLYKWVGLKVGLRKSEPFHRLIRLWLPHPRALLSPLSATDPGENSENSFSMLHSFIVIQVFLSVTRVFSEIIPAEGA